MSSKDRSEDRGRVSIEADRCKGCYLCVEMCPEHLLEPDTRLNRRGYRPVRYKGSGCNGCAICFHACPEPGGITVLRYR